MNRILSIVAGALVLAALPSAASAKAVLYEDFSGGVMDPAWTVYPHPAVTANVVQLPDGNHVLDVNNAGVVTFGDPSWTDYTVSARVFVYDGSYWAYAAGLLFRGQGNFVASDQANTFIYQTRPGTMQLERWTIPTAWTHVQEDSVHAFPPGEWHALKVVCRGTHFEFYVDGVLANVYDDPSAPLAGLVGFRTWGAGAYFDDLLVELPDAPGVLLDEDFTTGKLDPRWTLHSIDAGATQRVVSFEGRNVLEMNGSAMATIGDVAWTDYTSEGEFYVFNDWYSAWTSGMLFRTSPPLGNWHTTAGYDAGGRPYSQELERFGVNNTWWSYLVDTRVPVAARQWHKVKVIAEGARYRMFMDGQLVGDAVDGDPYLTGQAGFFTYNVGAYYTNLLVRVNDKLPPVTTATVNGVTASNGWMRTASVALAAQDQGLAGVQELRYALDGAAEVAVPGAAATVALAEGRHAVAFRAVDADLNEEAAQSRSVLVDATAPVVTLGTSPSSIKASRYPVTLKVTGSASDATSGVATVVIKVTDAKGVVLATFSAFGGTVSVPATKGMKYTVTATVTDAAGNVTKATKTVPVT